MKVSLIIVSYNGLSHLQALLPSIEQQQIGSHEMEVVLRDDCSTDGTSKWVAEHYPRIKLVTGKTNLGFAKSNNDAMKHATGEVLCCVNGDTLLDPRFVQEGLEILSRNAAAVAVNVNMIMPWVMTLEEYQDTPPDRLPCYEYQLTPYGYTRYVEVEKKVQETSFLSGGGFFLRRSALADGEELFDPRISIYCEDTELSLRLRQRGGKLLFAPKAIMYHNQVAKTADSIGEFKKLVKITWNRFYVMAKRHDPGRFTKQFPWYVAGIIDKMRYLGLPPSKLPLALLVGGGIAIPFFLLYPYWLLCSLGASKQKR